MLAKINSCAVIGLDATSVEVEVDTARGILSLTIVGLPDAAVQESRERVRSAIVNSGLYSPNKRLTINLAPANNRKTGPIHDLPMAMGILATTEQIPASSLEKSLVVGELSLDGSTYHVSGVPSMAVMAQHENFETFSLPAEDAAEASLIPGLPVIPVRNLAELVRHLNGLETLPVYTTRFSLEREPPAVVDLAHIHAGLVGGGSIPRPGEIWLAHRGVLFLDELPEFNSRALEVLRQPLEDKIVTISRASGTLTFPANSMLVAAQNPCPCGFYGDPTRDCTCSMGVISRYQKQISGPLLDRIDIHLEVPRVEYEKLADERLGEFSAAIRARVEEARERQRLRFASSAQTCNADMGPAEIQQYCKLDPAGQQLMRSAMQQLRLTARSFHRVLKLARTIADLSGEAAIHSSHLAEALQYRPRR